MENTYNIRIKKGERSIMCKQISAEYVLGSILIYKDKGVSLSDINRFERIVSKSAIEYLLDVSRSSIFNAIETWKDYFVYNDETIALTDYYKSNIDRIKYRFFETLDKPLQKVVLKAIRKL